MGMSMSFALHIGSPVIFVPSEYYLNIQYSTFAPYCRVRKGTGSQLEVVCVS